MFNNYFKIACTCSITLFLILFSVSGYPAEESCLTPDCVALQSVAEYEQLAKKTDKWIIEARQDLEQYRQTALSLKAQVEDFSVTNIPPGETRTQGSIIFSNKTQNEVTLIDGSRPPLSEEELARNAELEQEAIDLENKIIDLENEIREAELLSARYKMRATEIKQQIREANLSQRNQGSN